ncbi:MAG: GMC family oxidoreductase N-terminal domain-containing protein [Candidatus Binatia bacterium]
MAGTVVDCSRERVPERLSVEVCVIGSGSGGATVAWELAAAGREVLVLEEGGDYTGPALTERETAMYDQLYMDRGGRTTSDLSVSVMQGRVLGGGGVVNACDVVPIPDGVLRHWQRRYGLTDFAPAALAPYRDRALADLSANRPDEAQLNRNNRLLRAGAQGLGWRGEVMLHNRVGCAGIGACLIGCPLDAKRNPRFVAIPRALEAGARFLTRARAVRLEDASSDIKTIHVRRLDPKGYHEQGELTVRAQIVILAANAIASAQLLLRSGLGNAHVGRHLTLQPQLPILALFDDEVRCFRGIPQAYAITEFENLDDAQHGWWGFRIEAIGGTPGVVATSMPVYGPRAKEIMTRFPNAAMALLLTPDDGVGRVTVEASGRLRIGHELTDEHRGRLRQAARAAARLYLAAGAREVLLPVAPPVFVRSEADLAALDGVDLRPATAPLISAHQQGTVRMAPSERDGGADPDGRVYGTRDVYVFDTSGFPSSASSHTMAPVITVARFLSARLLARA